MLASTRSFIFAFLLLVITFASAQSTYQQLEAFQFLNKGIVTSNDVYEFVTQCALYTELQNVTNIEYSWATWGPYEYLWQRNLTINGSVCDHTIFNDTNLGGNDFFNYNTNDTDPTICQMTCCENLNCAAWTFGIAPTDFLNCTAGDYCCYMKDLMPALTNYTGLTSGRVTRNGYYTPPPLGMRSAVPLGGLGTGSFEIRADGSIAEWILMNQSPAGSAKYGTMNEAVFGIWTNISSALMLRTSPPGKYATGVEQLEYSGAFPTTKLSIQDSSLPVKASLYAFPEMHIGNAKLSATPAVVFALNVENPTSETIEVSFMFNLPLGVERDTNRTTFSSKGKPHKANRKKLLMGNYQNCFTACSVDEECYSWSYDGTNCILTDEIPASSYSYGMNAGVKGFWSSTVSDNLSMFTLNRPGTSPVSGNLTLTGINTDSTFATSFGAANTLEAIWAEFASAGQFSSEIGNATTVNGAVAVSTIMSPGEQKTLTIVMSWFYPHRDHVGAIVGNFYNNLYTDSEDVAQQVNTRLDSIVTDVFAFQQLFYNTTFPEYLQDIVLNSASHLRNAIWTADGRWRQWEAYDCNDIDSVHNDLQRQLPYAFFFPELEMNKMMAWASGQLSNGMIQETLDPNSCVYATVDQLDQAGGRVMADVTTGFIIEAYELYLWTGDEDFFNTIFPYVREAAIWQINVSSAYGIPSYMIDTYDILNLAQYEIASFNGFMHLAAMMACSQMAALKNESLLLAACDGALGLGQSTLLEKLWNGKYFRAYNGAEAVMGDTLYGQVWAYTLGLGNTVNNDLFLKSHLKSEFEHNDTPYGLRVLTGRDDTERTKIEDFASLGIAGPGPLDGCNGLIGESTDNAIWMGGSPDWTVLNLHLGMNVTEALSQTEKALGHWRSELNDLWNIHGLTAGEGYYYDGLPWCTSHYGFHMVLWHIPLALSGQTYSALTQSLTFWPKMTGEYQIPVLIPKIYGHLHNNGKGVYTLTILKSEIPLVLKELSVNSVDYFSLPITLNQGEAITWSSSD